MNILQKLDIIFQYENVDNFLHKFKYVIIIAIVALFAAMAGYNYNTKNVMQNSKNDTSMIFDVVRLGSDYSIKEPEIKDALSKVKTKQGEEYLTLELAKTYKANNDFENYEKTLLDLQKAKTSLIAKISSYMLAELYLAQDSKKAIEFIDAQKIKKSTFTYSLMQELKAMALEKIGDLDGAAKTYTATLNLSNVTASQKQRLEIKLDQLNKKLAN